MAPIDPFEITVRTYIPMESVLGFSGDGRSASTDPNASYRTSHTVGVETNPSVSRNPETYNDKGKTGLTKTSFGLPPTGAPLIGKAPEGGEGGFKATVTRSDANRGDNAVINFVGSSSNPFTPDATAIDYDFTIKIIPGKEGADLDINLEGSYDGFLAYEINITDGSGNTYQLYHDAPSGAWKIVYLLGSKDKQVAGDELREKD